MSAPRPLEHPLLASCGVVHGFGVRGSAAPAGCVRPLQRHGTRVMVAHPGAGEAAEEADAVVSSVPGLAVAVVTADCVPILLADCQGAHVAAIHAGWRGLAAGVVAEGVRALVRSGAAAPRIRGVIGPHIGPCCYEVDDPVASALRERFASAAGSALRPARPGHFMLDLAALVRDDCLREGLSPDSLAAVEGACTRCDAERFHSYRRDGARAGRLLHFVAARHGPSHES